MKLESSKWVVTPLVPEEVYTDRHELLDYFYDAALETAHRRTMSTVLLGQEKPAERGADTEGNPKAGGQAGES